MSSPEEMDHRGDSNPILDVPSIELNNECVYLCESVKEIL